MQKLNIWLSIYYRIKMPYKRPYATNLSLYKASIYNSNRLFDYAIAI